MRFRRLDLIAFGHFTEHSIDLSQGSYGLHLIYGPNEAGKSTSLRALTALLFNFPYRTDDNFKHENKSLRVGATLENREGKLLSCVRRKARSSTLLHADSSEEVKADLWSQFLPKIQEDQFLRMFGLNHVSLREGGAELVRGSGDSGQALFSSASGIANLHHKRLWLDQQIEEIFAKSKRKGRLLDKLNEYKSLRDEEKKVSLTMDQWRTFESQLSDARKQIEGHKSRLDSLHRSLLEAQRIQRSIQTVRNYLDRQKALEELGQSSKLPEDFENRVQKAYQSKAQKQVSIEGIETEIRNVEQKISEIPERDWSDEQGLRIDKLISGLGLYEQAIQQQPSLNHHRDELARQAAQKWKEIGSFETLKNRLESEPIPISQKKWVETLAKQYESLEKQIADSYRVLAKLKKRLEEDGDTVQQQPSQDAIDRLEQRVLSARSLTARHQELAEQEQSYHLLNQKLEQGLRKWKVSVESIESLTQWTIVTSTSIERWDKELEKRRESIEKAKSDLESNLKKRAAKQRELDREVKKGHVPTRQEWESSKQTRDEFFRILSEQRSGTAERWSELAQAYEQSKAGADEIAAELLDQADLVAQREQLQQALEELQAQVDESTQALEAQQNEFNTCLQAWLKYSAEQKIAADTPLEALQWLQAVLQLQRDAQDLLDRKRRIEQTHRALEDSAKSLREALEACGASSTPSDAFDALLALAESVLRAATQERGKAQAILKQRQLDQQEHDEKAHEIQGLEEDLSKLQKQWWEALAGIALPHNATPMQVQTILEQISELQKITEEFEKNRDSIRLGQEQIQTYEKDVEIAIEWLSSRNPEALAELIMQGSIATKVRFLERYGKQVIQERTNRESLIQIQQQACDRLVQARKDHSVLVEELQHMMEFANANTLDRLLELAKNSRNFHMLDTDRKQLRERLQDECNSRDIENFIEKVRQADPDQLAIDIKNFNEQIAKTEQDREESIKLCSGLERDYQNLDTGGRASALATQASGIAVEIEEAVQELAILRLASAALSEGIERYRSANEDPILKLASESFSQMTLGRFRGVEIALDEDGKHLLVGRRNQEGPGSEVSVEQMSDGTRDQLYLALRLASLQQWNAVHEPMPLIVDDILVHFDDDRSVETLKQLVRLSDQTQVIFFTHHQHLIELANEHLPADKVFLHNLP